MATLPTFSFTIAYFVFILAVTISTLLMIIFGGWITSRLQKGGLRFGFANKTTLHRKFFGFLLFIIAIFLAGWLSERLQNAIYMYLQQNVATSISGLAIAFLVAWVLYDWLVWRKHNK
jgi:ABC-type spermidine/putrescine transport system permease subunit II